MRKIVLTFAALAAFGLALPAVSNPASARDREVVIIKKHHDHGWHRGWQRGHREGWNHRRHGQERRHGERHGASVVIR